MGADSGIGGGNSVSIWSLERKTGRLGPVAYVDT